MVFTKVLLFLGLLICNPNSNPGKEAPVIASIVTASEISDGIIVMDEDVMRIISNDTIVKVEILTPFGGLIRSIDGCQALECSYSLFNLSSGNYNVIVYTADESSFTGNISKS